MLASMSDSPRKPTSAELDVLAVLWSEGPSTVRAVHSRLSKKKATGYTTVLKTMQIMAEKGLVTRDETGVAHICTAAVAEDETRRQFVSDLSSKLFQGRPAKLALHALADQPVTARELDEISALIERMRA